SNRTRRDPPSTRLAVVAPSQVPTTVRRWAGRTAVLHRSPAQTRSRHYRGPELTSAFVVGAGLFALRLEFPPTTGAYNRRQLRKGSTSWRQTWRVDRNSAGAASHQKSSQSYRRLSNPAVR